MKRLLIYHIIFLVFFTLCPLTTQAQGIMRGDVNADGIINAADLVELINHINGKTTPQFHLEYADLNRDGFIDRSDARNLAQLITAMEPRPLDGKAICIGTETKDWSEEVPCVATVAKECAIIGLTNKKEETVFLVFDFMNYISYILCPTDNGFVLAPYDPTTDEASNKFICWQRSKDKNYVAVVNEDPTNHEMQCDTLCITSNISSAAMRTALPVSISSTESMIYGQMANLYGDIGKGIADVTDITGIHEQVLPGKVVTKPSDVSGLISKQFSALSERYQGLSVGVTVGEELIGMGEDNVLKMIFGDKNKAVAITKHALSIIQRHTDFDLKDLWRWSSDEDAPEDNPYIDMGYNPQPSINNTWNQRNRMATMQIPDLTQQQAYRVEVQATDITSTSAVISGSYKEIYPEGSIINMGYILEGPNGKQDVSAFGLTPTLIKKLEPDSKYTVYAYLASASAPGGRYMSKPVTFVTEKEEKFDLFMDVTVFGCEGGSQPIDVYALEGVTWSIQDVPTWVKVTTDDDSFTVTVGETEEEREAYFTIVVTYSDGTTEYIPFRVTQKGEEEEVTLDTDIIFEGELEYFYDHNHWVNGEAHPQIEQEKMPIMMGFSMDEEGHANLSIVVEDNVLTLDLANPVTTISMLTGERLNGERKKDGWRYVLTTHNYEAKDDEIRLDWTIDGDWVIDEKGNTASDVTYSIKGSGYSKNVGYIAISGLTTDSPVLDWFDATELETEYTYTYDFLNQKTHYKYHDKDYAMGQLKGYWNDEDE